MTEFFVQPKPEKLPDPVLDKKDTVDQKLLLEAYPKLDDCSKRSDTPESLKVKETEKAKEKEAAKEIASIITGKGDFAYGHKRRQIKEILAKAAEHSQAKLDRIIKAVNEQFKKSGSTLRLKSHFDGSGCMTPQTNHPGYFSTFKLNNFKVDLYKGKKLEDRLIVEPQ